MPNMEPMKNTATADLLHFRHTGIKRRHHPCVDAPRWVHNLRVGPVHVRAWDATPDRVVVPARANTQNPHQLFR